MRHLLASLLVGILAAQPALALSPPFILTTGVDDAGDFVSLAESTTFGPGGTIFDYSTRIVPKEYHGPPPANGTYTTTTTMADSCSSDDTTWETLKEYLDGDGTGDAADNTVIVLPASCRIKAFLAPGYGDSPDLTIANKYDNVKLYCADEDTCGFETNLDSVSDAVENNRATVVQVGASGITAVSGDPSYSITATGYTWGSKMIQSASAIDVTDSGDGVAWGPGDIVEIRLSRITGYGSNTPDWMTRVACIRDNSGNLHPATGGQCDEITGNNQFQLTDVPPLNLNPTAYYWGDEGLGASFTPHSSEGGDLSGTYAATSGHTIYQVERMGTTRCGIVGDGSVCGIGTETNNVPENVWFDGVSFTVADDVLGTRYLVGANMYGGGNYRGNVERTVGRVSAFTYGNRSGGWRVSHVSMHSMNWSGTGANVKCIGKIIAINAGDPVTVDVETADSTYCDPTRTGSSNPDWNEPETMFSWDVVDTRLAGKRFRTTQEFNSGTPNFERITLTGFNASSLSPALDTTVAGYAANIDRYAGSSYYLNDSTSYFQTINNWFKDTRQHSIMQGCAGCTYAANYVTSDGDESEGGRGPFFHGNRGESGFTADLNDQNQPMTIIDSGNAEPVGHGEGANHAFCLNRVRTWPTLTWPQGTETGSNYGSGNTLVELLKTGQNGAANDSWSFLLNSSEAGLWFGTIDLCDNDDTDPSGTGDATCVTAGRQPNEPPAGQLFEPAAYRNRCASCNQDSNWRTSTGDPQWGTPYTDIRATEYGDSTSTPGAPFTDERTGAPQSCFFTAVPEFWCNESGTMGEMGANWDDFSGTLNKLPAQIRYEINEGLGGTCTLP